MFLSTQTKEKVEGGGAGSTFYCLAPRSQKLIEARTALVLISVAHRCAICIPDVEYALLEYKDYTEEAPLPPRLPRRSCSRARVRGTFVPVQRRNPGPERWEARIQKRKQESMDCI